MFDLLKIYPMPGGSILSNLWTPSTTKTKNQPFVPSVNNLDPSTSKIAVGSNSNVKTTANKYALIGKNSKSTTPPFLLTFEIFNRNVHNCMIDFGASSNVMPYPVCKKLNAKPTPCEIQISQLVRSKVKIVGELKGVMIRMGTNPQIFQVIDIVVADIPDVYGIFLSRD